MLVKLIRRFAQSDIKPYAEPIIVALLKKIESGATPEKIAQNDHLMKCAFCWRSSHKLNYRQV
jgi:hypothetical protein